MLITECVFCRCIPLLFKHHSPLCENDQQDATV